MKLLTYLLFLTITVFPIVMQGQELRTSVYFESAQYTLLENEQSELNTFLKNLPANLNSYDILLVGHTDNVGNEGYNQKLSKQRCKAVKDYLLTQNVRVPQVAYEGKGFHAPAASNSTQEGKAKNRRVELVFMASNTFSDAPVQVQKEQFRFDASEGTSYTYERSGTKINIPANALVYRDGSPVKGEVKVNYREFRDAADFIATDISMMYDHQHQFESAGMFELTANQGDRSVFVKEGESLDVEFMMTSDTVEDVNFYAYENNEWRTLGALDRVTQTNRFDIKSPCNPVYNYKMPKIKEDTLKTFLNAMRTGYYLSKEEDCRQYYRVGFKEMDERFEDFRYAGTEYLHSKVNKIDWDRIAGTDALFPIRFNYNEEYIQTDPTLREIRLPEGLWVEWQRGNGKHANLRSFPELQNLSKRRWMILSKGKYKPSARAKALTVLTENYMDARVEYLGNEQFQFVLKGLMRFDTLAATPVFERSERKNKEEVCQMIIANYNRNFQKRQRRFDQRIQLYKESWKYFLAFSKSLMTSDEKCKGISNWLQHFYRNRSRMTARYYPYTGLANNIDSIRPLLTKAMVGMPIKLEAPLRSPDNRLAQRLQINGFGVFNCDAIKRMGKERMTIVADFVDEEGLYIDAKVINVVDYAMNGVVRFYDQDRITFNPTKNNVMVVTDFFGDVYLVSAEAIRANEYRAGKKQYEFKVERIMSNTVEAIRDAIALR